MISEKSKQIIKYAKDHPDVSLDQVGKYFGVTRQWVSYVLINYSNGRNSVNTRKGKIRAEQIEEIISKREVTTAKEIAEKLGLSRWVVYDVLRKMGVNPLDFGQTAKNISYVEENMNKKTKQEMADELGVDIRTIEKYLRSTSTYKYKRRKKKART